MPGSRASSQQAGPLLGPTTESAEPSGARRPRPAHSPAASRPSSKLSRLSSRDRVTPRGRRTASKRVAVPPPRRRRAAAPPCRGAAPMVRAGGAPVRFNKLIREVGPRQGASSLPATATGKRLFVVEGGVQTNASISRRPPAAAGRVRPRQWRKQEEEWRYAHCSNAVALGRAGQRGTNLISGAVEPKCSPAAPVMGGEGRRRGGAPGSAPIVPRACHEVLLKGNAARGGAARGAGRGVVRAIAGPSRGSA